MRSSFKETIKSLGRLRILTILFLGFAAGLPLVLTASTLKAWLQDNSVNIAEIGLFSLVGLSYSIKFLWAPVVDHLKIPFLYNRFGRRKSWLFLMQILLCVSVFFMGYFGSFGYFGLLALFSVLTTFLSATQDISIDAYRIESLPQDEQGLGASAYVYGYRLGMLLSGAGALILSDRVGWLMTYSIMSVILLIISQITLLIKEPAVVKINGYKREEEVPVSEKIKYKVKEATKDVVNKIKGEETECVLCEAKHNVKKHILQSIIMPFKDFMKKPQWYLILLLVLFYKFTDAFAGSLTTPFLMDIGFSKTEIAAIVKTFGLVATLLGVFGGGVVVKGMNIRKAMWLGMIIQVLSNFMYVIQAQAGYYPLFLYFTIAIENFTCGIATAIFIAYLSGLCNVSYTATQYALLSAFATTGRSVLASFSGFFVVWYGWTGFFVFSMIFSIPGIILLYFVMKNTKVSSNSV